MLRSIFFLVIALTGGWAHAQFDCIDPELINPDVVCLDIYDPVCGCDGVTYSNECYAVNYGGVTSYTIGECGQNVECFDLSGIDFGLCDMAMGVGLINGDCTFISGCGWEVNGIDYSPYFFESMELCTSQCEGTLCVDVGNVDFGECEMAMGYAIVFGNCTFVSGCGWVVDGVDYAPYFFDSFETCNTACANQLCVDENVIDEQFQCEGVLAPVCGCDGVTYMNACNAFYYHGITTSSVGGCACYDEAVIDINVLCIDIFDPVCGCDNVTYINSCVAYYMNGITTFVSGECPMGVGESTLSFSKIYPNPVSDFVWIESNQNFDLRVHNSLGQLVFEYQSSEFRVKLALGDLPLTSGVYIFELFGEHGARERKRIVVQ